MGELSSILKTVLFPVVHPVQTIKGATYPIRHPITSAVETGKHLGRNYGTYGTAAAGYGGLYDMGEYKTQKDYESEKAAIDADNEKQGLPPTDMKPPEFSKLDPLLKPLQGAHYGRRWVADKFNNMTDSETKRHLEQNLASLHPDVGSDYLRIPNTSIELPESVVGEGGAGLAILALARYKGKLKFLNKPMHVGGVDVNQPILGNLSNVKHQTMIPGLKMSARDTGKLAVGSTATGTALGTLGEADSKLAGRPLVESPANVQAREAGAVKDAEAFKEKRRQYEQDNKNENERMKKLVDQEYGSAYGFKPGMASAVSGSIGAAAGYMLPEENKMLWSLAGGATGAVLPYILAKMIPKQAAEAQVATSATSPGTGMETSTKPGAVTKPIDWHELWNKYKYDIGAGAAGGGAIAAGANAYFNPDERWWSIPTSGGLAGLSYVLARKGNAHRWAYPKEEELGPLSQKGRKHHTAIHPLPI